MRFNYILTASLLALALAACTGEEPVGYGSIEDGQQITITGSIINNPGTKTYMGPLTDDGHEFYPVYWSDGDKIALFSKSTVNVFTLNEIETDRTEAAFVGNAGDMPLQFDGSEIYPAAYPADRAFSKIDTDGNVLIGSYLPFQQKYQENTFSDDVFPMAAASTDGENYGFWNLCGVIQIPVLAASEGQSVRAVYLSGNNDEVVAGGVGMVFDPVTGEPVTDGTVSGDENNGKKIKTYGSEGYTRIIVNFDEPVELSTTEPTYVNIAVIPQLFEGGITVELVDAANLGRSSYKVSSPLTIKRSILTRLTTIDYLVPEPCQVANSYIYSDAGYYIMPAFAMGNRLDVKLPVEGRNVKADLLWSELINVNYNTTDRNDLKPAVTNIDYLVDEDGYGMLQLKINIDPATGEPYRGNAAVALYDEDTKEILWSWHVWMCEPVHDVITGGACADGTYTYQLPGQEPVNYAAEASSGKLIIMDRNLGAISADPADGWKTYGLYYENGRRDPFIGGHWDGNPNAGTRTSYTNGQKDNLQVREDEGTPFSVGTAATAPVWYNEELSKGWKYLNKYQNVSTALRNPMVFSSGYLSAGNGQWTLFTDSDNKSWLDPTVGGDKKKGDAGATLGPHGRTGLSDGGHEAYWNRTKTIMDPCPVGYSVLGERGGLFLDKDTKTFIWEDAGGDHPEHAVYGMQTSFTFGGVNYVTWWPAAGVRTITGKLGDVGYRGMYYHYDHIAATHGGHGSGFEHANKTEWKTGIMTNHASSVRCVREKQFTDNVPTTPLN